MDEITESSDVRPAEQIMDDNYDQMVSWILDFRNHILDENPQLTNAPLLRRGSNPDGMPLEHAFCGFWKYIEAADAKNDAGTCACTRLPAAETCPQCNLVRYCGRLCMEQHIRDHQQLCKSVLCRHPFNSFSCLPADRNLGKKFDLPETHVHLPTLNNPPFPVYGLLQDLAIEGSPLSYSPAPVAPSLSSSVMRLPKHLRFFFPCAYDLRNVLVTVCQIPENYKYRVTLFINSAECILAVRDVLILELLRRHGLDGIDAALALWFSTALTTVQDFLVLKAIRQIIRSSESNDGIDHSLRYQCLFPSSSTGSFLRADLCKSMVNLLYGIASCTFGDDFEPRRQYWQREEEHKDKEAKIACALPAHLASWSRYYTQGLSLPFGAWNAHFLRPNRLRYSTSMDFITRYRNDVICGWNIQQLIASGFVHGASPMDLYGCLFFHVRDLMETFMRRISSCSIELRVTQFEPGKFAQILQKSSVKFHRIDACALAHYNMTHSSELSSTDRPELPVDVRRYLHKLELQRLVSDPKPNLTLSGTVEVFGKLLGEDASDAWPSLLLTASLDWASKVREEITTEQQLLVECSSAVDSSYHTACLHAQYAQDQRYPNLMCCLKDLLGKHFLSYVKEFNVDENVKQITGLERKSKHQIISPNCIPMKPRSRVENDRLHYFNLLFNGFTFLEQFQEWGWPSKGKVDATLEAISALQDLSSGRASGEIVDQTTTILETNEFTSEVVPEAVDGLMQLILEKPVADEITSPPDLELSLAPSWLRHSDTSGHSLVDDQPAKDAAAKY